MKVEDIHVANPRALGFHIALVSPETRRAPRRHLLREALIGSIPTAGALLAVYELARFFITGGF